MENKTEFELKAEGRQLSDNELIAEFMGLPLTKEMPEFGTGNWKEVPFQSWKYHQSWDWLMGVVEKITPLAKGKQLAWFDVSSHLLDANIDVVYRRCVDFIKWYNSQRVGAFNSNSPQTLSK